MDPAFNDIFTSPWNDIFKVVFYPDRIYHAEYLNATRSPRYRYNVREVRSYLGINALKGEVYLDGKFLSNFLRLEYRSSRLVEQTREKKRLFKDHLIAWVRVLPEDESKKAEAMVKLSYCSWIDAYEVEIWETLEPPAGSYHDFQVLDQMGRNGAITRVKAFSPALQDIKSLTKIELAFRENDRNLPSGYQISSNETVWDNDYSRSHQEPRTQDPSSPQNTISDLNYLINFQRGWYLQTPDIAPVRYRNAMMDGDNPDKSDNNIIDMRWIIQRELGGSMVFFHEVTVPPGVVEGTHQHIGTEELYFITEGEGFAYMRVGDDPATEKYPTVERQVMGLGKKEFKELPVKPGSVIFTKSGGMHGIRNPGTKPLKFVAFLYHTN
ncbi:cupin domain-containing protein [Anabaena catenula]|uniref:Cupin domain-containing protein n=1 Tax=Anabaena catenula FACHB-362 TaxID=2692877 RepID=A0ABR8JD19_9NOST|nr:cupin domain-containing protein [Anabaena catenula]MBD2695157.1 cupin domain-containing protein [Anabaena catenula FACHB-362]